MANLYVVLYSEEGPDDPPSDKWVEQGTHEAKTPKEAIEKALSEFIVEPDGVNPVPEIPTTWVAVPNRHFVVRRPTVKTQTTIEF